MQNSFELTNKQAEYIRNANHRWNVSCGAVRSGKSYLQISYLIPSRLLERKNMRGLCVFIGATRANIERNILTPLRDIYGESAASSINSNNWAKVLGVRVYCVGANDIRQVAKIRGSEISYCAIDEATDINKEVFEMLKSRLSLPWSCCDITTNPAGPNHWFKEFLDSRDRGVDIYLQEYTIYDNPFLPEEYVHNLEAEHAGSVWYNRYILGKWTLAEGLIFPDFMKALYDCDFEDTASNYIVSIDYGTSNPLAAMLWEKRESVWYSPTELYYSGRDTGVQKSDGKYLTMIKDWIGEWVPEEYEDNVTIIIDPSAASFITLLREDGNFKIRSANNSVLDGIRETNTAIERGLIKVHWRCKSWIKEVQGYVWDEKCGEDRPVKENDHLMDSMRYFVKTMRVTRALDEYRSIFR